MITLHQQLKRQILFWSLSVVLAIAGTTITFSPVAQASTQADACGYIKNISLSQNSSGARKLFRSAYENRYTWDEQFPGYTAAVELKQDKEDYKGHIRINSNLSVEVTGINKKDARQTVENQLRMMITHRRAVGFEVAHKNQTYEFGVIDKSGAVEIFEKGDTTNQYKVFHQQIIQVNRILGNIAVTVNLLDSLITPEGYLATRYKTIYRQPQTQQVLGEEETEDTYKKIGNYYLLTSRIIHNFELGKQTTTQIILTEIKLL